MTVSPFLRFHHLSPLALIQPEADVPSLLGAISFSRSVEDIHAPVLGAPSTSGEEIVEAWFGNSIMAHGRKAAIRYRHDGHWLFGAMELEEIPVGSESPLQRAAESAYGQIFALMDELKFPYVYRFWNYLSDINTVSYGLERYRQFNLGRQDAFLSSGRKVTGDLPAACALGLQKGPLRVAFLAGHVPGIAIENPRQVSAYHYPQDYGPRSPSFSRACLLREAGLLFISGTASIVGHRTLHAGDVTAQTRETLANIHAVIEEANRQVPPPGFDAGKMAYRVYIRRAADRQAIAEEMHRLLGHGVKLMFVEADICREELLLEIEATAFLEPASA